MSRRLLLDLLKTELDLAVLYGQYLENIQCSVLDPIRN